MSSITYLTSPKTATGTPRTFNTQFTLPISQSKQRRTNPNTIQIQNCLCGCEICASNTEILREGIKLAEKEIEQLQYMLNFRDIGLEKRDVMLNKYMEQMTRSNEEIKELKMSNQKLTARIQRIDMLQEDKRQLINNQLLHNQQNGDTDKISKMLISQQSLSQDVHKNAPRVLIRNNSTYNSSKKMQFQSKDSFFKERLNEKYANTTNSRILRQSTLPLGEIIKQVDATHKINKDSPRNQHSMLNRSVTTSKINLHQERRRNQNSSHQISVPTVTQTQGRFDDQVLFRNELENTTSLMDRGEENLLSNEKYLFLERLFEIPGRFSSYYAEMNESQQKSMINVLQLCVNDLKRFYSLALRYKELLSVTNEIAKYSSFENAFDLILKKICQHLKCDTASIFLADYQNKELWTIANTSFATIRFPLDVNSIAGYCICHEIAMNVFDAYDDPRFNKKVDIDTGYRTKTILCVPIKDENNKIIGCLEAINKIHGLFDSQDQDMLELLGNFSSSILKNSMSLDRIILQREYYKKLISVGNSIPQRRSIREVVLECEEKLKELISCDHCNIWLYSTHQSSLLHYIKNHQEPISYSVNTMDTGIIMNVFRSRKMDLVKDVKDSSEYDSKIDINSNLGLITLPIMNSSQSELIGIYQASYTHYFVHASPTSNHNYSLSNDVESFQLYANIISQVLAKQIYIDQLLQEFAYKNSSNGDIEINKIIQE